MRYLAAATFLVLSACSSSETELSRTLSSEIQEDDRSPEKSAGWCTQCNYFVYGGHRCGLTAPCKLCSREAGARHLHEVVWYCAADDIATSQQHECLDAKTCTTCRADRRRLLGPKACDRCHRQVPPQRVHGITRYCGACNLETGANHVCKKTRYCRNCLREAGKGHVCDATRYCPDHEEEHAPDHIHGYTTYCKRCHREAGADHRHGLTEWCFTCEGEVEWPHCHHH
jgi:hypothetical protein